jgi:hypothetical protein
MREGLIRFACIAILLVIAAAWFSTLSAFHWNAEADGVLVNGLNASGILEDGQGAPVPVLNQGKPALPCPECAGYVLTDWRRSPTVFGGKGSLYPGHRVGNRWVFDNPPAVEKVFGRKPLKGNQ